MIQHHGPVESAPVMGHADTSFEATDARVGIIIGSLLIIVITLIITAAIVFPIHKILQAVNPPGQLPSPIAPARVVPPEPVLQVHPAEVYPDLLASQEKILHSYGKNAAGQVHIPIEQAINDVAGQLPVRANAPEGYTVPGGQGRDFSKSLADMPPAYQRQQPGPTIQGEIQKNAQK
jgi:hypothetical protein